MAARASVSVSNELGVHARPAARIASVAQTFESEIHILLGEERANAKSIMAVMMLAAAQGSRLEIVADGEDEEDALAAMVELVRSGFPESGA